MEIILLSLSASFLFYLAVLITIVVVRSPREVKKKVIWRNRQVVPQDDSVIPMTEQRDQDILQSAYDD